jgi:transcriptional regulator
VQDGLGVLRGHLARANPQWRDHLPQSQGIAIFNGPQHYVSPAWYPSTTEHGKVVPTWNYVAVHAYGTLSFKSDAAWLFENVRALTDHQEASNQNPWRVTDAPPEFIDSMLQAIVGVELTITGLEGKWKVSQNRPLADREGVIAALRRLDSAESLRMAELVGAPLQTGTDDLD